MDFTINRSWDNDPRDYSIDIKLSREGDFVIMEINAPFFFDPSPGGKPGEPMPQLWMYEVVEAFFLGTDNMYLEVELAPRGQHLLLFLAGHKNAIKMELPLNYTTKIDGNKWYGRAEIPIDYFPPNVTLFNAYAIHGETVARVYDALYPAEPGVYEDPDFHRLHLFKPIAFDSLVKRDVHLSEKWVKALEEAGIEYNEDVLNSPENMLEFRIGTDWQGYPVHHTCVTIKLRAEVGFVVMEIFSPFYVGRRPKRGPFPKLWEGYEAVRAFFFGSSAMYLEVDCSPYGECVAVFLASPNNPIMMFSTLDYFAKIKGRFWTGIAKIPVSYFPPRCTLFNAHAIYGSKKDRRYESLYPADRGRFKHPKLHMFQYFKEVDFEKILKRNEDFSVIWRRSLVNAGIEHDESKFFVPKAENYEFSERELTNLELNELDSIIKPAHFYKRKYNKFKH